MARHNYPGPLKEGTAEYRRWYNAAVWFLARSAPVVITVIVWPRCGARCRDGHRCRARAVRDKVANQPRNGRCRAHGGLSTGPRTEEGKRRSREGAKKGGRVSAERRKRRPVAHHPDLGDG